MVRDWSHAANGRLQGPFDFVPKPKGSGARPDTFGEFAKNVLYQTDTTNAH